MHFIGQNSFLFHTGSHLSETLRSSLLFHEVRRRINTKVPVIVGDPIKYSEIDENLSNTELSEYLRNTTYKINPIWKSRDVPLGKRLPGDVKKSKVFVKNAAGKVVKVNFGDKNMTIKKDNPARRRSFRARHNCDNPGPKTKARYWSCKAW